MKFVDTINRSARNLRQAKTRTILTALALAVGGFTLTLTLAAANGAKAYSNRLIATNIDPTSLIVTKDKSLFGSGGSVNSKPQEYDDSLASLGNRGLLVKELSQSDLDKIAKLSGVSSIFQDYNTNAQYVTREGAKKYTASTQSYDDKITHQYAAGSVNGEVPDGSVVMPDNYVSLLNFSSANDAIGKDITVALQQTTGAVQYKNYKIIAITSTPSTLITGDVGSTLLLSAKDAKSNYDFVHFGTINANRFLFASARITNGYNIDNLNAAKKVIEQAGFAAESAADTQALINQIINVLQIIILVFGFITLIASFFGVVNTQYISVLERTREIGLMKALGMGRRSVLSLFVIEATWIGFLGALIGSVGAVMLGTTLNPWISHKLNFGQDRLLLFKPMQIIGLIVFLMLVTTIAGILPARRAAKLDPIEALRTE
jgi:putative ABC transport system permease protein